MKKNMFLCAGLCAVLAFTSCKSSENAYKKAYEKAQAKQEQPAAQPVQEDVPVVAPLVERPVTETTVVDNTDNVAVRSENFTLIDGSGLSNFSVVVGSYGVKANAEGMQSQLRAAGRDAQIVYSPDRNLYRVVAATFVSKADAVRLRDQLSAKYPGAWLLYKK